MDLIDEGKITAIMSQGGIKDRAVAEALLRQIPDLGDLQKFSAVNKQSFDGMKDQTARKNLTTLVESNPQIAGQLASAYKKSPIEYGRTLNGFVASANADPNLATDTVAALGGKLTPKGEQNLYAGHLAGYLADPVNLKGRIAYDKTRMAAPAPAPAIQPAALVVAGTTTSTTTPAASAQKPVAPGKGKKKSDPNAGKTAKVAAKKGGAEVPVSSAAATAAAAALMYNDKDTFPNDPPAASAQVPSTDPAAVTAPGAPPPPPKALGNLTAAEASAVLGDVLEKNPEFRKLVEEQGLKDQIAGILEKDPNAARNFQNSDVLAGYTAQLKAGKKDDFLNDFSGKKIETVLSASSGLGGLFGGKLGDMINQFLPRMMDWGQGMFEMMTGMFNHMFSGLKNFFGMGDTAKQTNVAKTENQPANKAAAYAALNAPTETEQTAGRQVLDSVTTGPSVVSDPKTGANTLTYAKGLIAEDIVPGANPKSFPLPARAPITVEPLDKKRDAPNLGLGNGPLSPPVGG